MKIVIPTATAAGITAVVVTRFVNRDFMLLAASITIAGAYALVLYTLWPLVRKRSSPLAPAMTGIAFFSIISVGYTVIAIALGRPDWYINGWPFYVFMAAYGGLVGSVGMHLLSLGAARGQKRNYIIILCILVVASFALAGWIWFVLMDRGLHAIYTD